MDKMMRKLRKI